MYDAIGRNRASAAIRTIAEVELQRCQQPARTRSIEWAGDRLKAPVVGPTEGRIVVTGP